MSKPFTDSVKPFEERTKFEIEVPRDAKLWFVSDTHFGHRKLTTGAPDHFERTRPYRTTEEMDSAQFAEWMRVIEPGDIVLFLGDFQFGQFNGNGEEAAWKLWQELPGHKFFVRGNHDQKIKGELFDVRDYALVKYKDLTYLCQHFPFTSDFAYDKPDQTNLLALRKILDPKTTVLVHGHTHSSDMFSKVKMKDFTIQNNVSWDVLMGPVPAERLYTADHIYHGKCLEHPVVERG